MGEIDGRFACYVVFARDAFEVKVEKRLGHEGFPEFLTPIGLSGAHPQFVVWRPIEGRRIAMF